MGVSRRRGTANVEPMGEVVVHVGDARLVAAAAGEGGRPLLLVHGFTGCKEDFADEMDRLADLGFHVVAPDLVGHGASTHPTDEAAYSFDRFAADVFAVADHLGWERFDLLGHSMGGMVAQVMVLERPERIARLILMDTHHGRIEGIDADLVALGVHLARTEGLEVIQQLLREVEDPTDSPAYERTCAERPGYREWAEAKMLACAPAMYASMLAQLESTTDRLEQLRTVTCPTLVLVGELDAAFVPASERMAAAIPGARLAVLPDGGHCPQFEATAAWRAAIDEFLLAPLADGVPAPTSLSR